MLHSNNQNKDNWNADLTLSMATISMKAFILMKLGMDTLSITTQTA
jgi:hypothetical protein